MLTPRFVFALLVLSALAAARPVIAQNTTKVVDASTLDGKVLFGYQGWFRTPGDGSNVGWSHWSRGAPPTAENMTVDLYPDLSEFDAQDLCPIPGEMIGAKPAYLFSSYNKNVVMKHFEWMKKYGLDGVLVQRFLSDIPGSRAQGDGVLKNIIAAAEKTGRVFAIEYDISARKWASEASAMMQSTEIDEQLRPLLADSYDEMLAAKVPGDGQKVGGFMAPSNHEGELPLKLADFLSTKDIMTLAGHSHVTASEKRILLASGWLRTYLLEGRQRSLDMLPQLRDAFPELATDIDNIKGTFWSFNQKHLLTRMMLRVPGFSYSPSWTRAAEPDDRRHRHYTMGGGSDDISGIFAVDSYNPNDANWWCAADVEQIKLDILQDFFVGPINVGGDASLYRDKLMPVAGAWWNGIYQDNQRVKASALADKIIAWHPLLKNANLDELGRLAKVECGPKMLSEQAIAWAHSSNFITRWLGFDEYLPETLHLAVRSTRYGCRRDGPHGAYSREAYNILHRQFADSEWAAKTPYWFDHFWDTPQPDENDAQAKHR